jgi:hypothetical protein
MRLSTNGLFFSIFILGFLTSGCASTQVESRLQEQMDSLGVRATQLRLINLERATRFSLTIEAASDSIIRSTNDPEIRDRALEWRIYMVPTFRQILFSPDPAAGSLDGWVCSIQMRQFFTIGEGSSYFGTLQEIAIRTAAQLESDFTIVRGGSSAHEMLLRIAKQALEWSSNHPMAGPYYARTSVIPFLKDFQMDIDYGLTGTLGNIAVDVRAISSRIDLLSAQLPREARWQAEYMMSDLEVGGRLDSLTVNLAAIMSALARLTTTMERGSLTIDIKSLRTLHEDIRRLEEMVMPQREIVLEEIDRQRLETLARIEAATDLVLARATSNATGLADHLFWRFALLMAAGFGGAVLLILLFRRSH